MNSAVVVNIVGKEALKKTINKNLDKGVMVVTNEIKGACSMLGSNFIMRRNVGFEFLPSLKGSFIDTKNYYRNKMAGLHPEPMKQAVYFND